MRVYINRQPVKGPWGGGNKTVTKLAEGLLKRGHDVIFRLEEHIDVIFCFDPRPNDYWEWYQHFYNYRESRGGKIIQRAGDLGTHSKPELTDLVKQTVVHSDFIIFPSVWAKEFINYSKDNCEVVFNCPMKMFYENRNENTELGDKIKLVTHHWSKNPKKGFDYYKKLDEFIGETDHYEFTYIGRKPDDLEFKNSTYIPAIEAAKLKEKLPEHDIYITASVEEAGANHVLEALAAGLPVIYHKDGGSIPNYCENYGIEYSSFEELIESLEAMKNEYGNYKTKVLSYNKKMDDVVEQYIEIIEMMGENNG